jgi:hypothetical protein
MSHTTADRLHNISISTLCNQTHASSQPINRFPHIFHNILLMNAGLSQLHPALQDHMYR